MNTRIAAICWCLVLAGMVCGQSLQGTCTIDVPDLGGALGTPPGDLMPGMLRTSGTIDPGSVVQTDPGNWVGLLLQTAATAQPSAAAGVQVAVCLGESSRLAISPGGEPRPHVQVQQGLAVISYEPGSGGAGLLVSTLSDWVRLERGTVVVTVAAEGSDFAILAGQATRFAGAIPADISTVQGGTGLSVQADAPLAQRGTALAARVMQVGVAQASKKWLVMASQGDLIPVKEAESLGRTEAKAVEAPSAEVTPSSVSAASLTSVVATTAMAPSMNAAQTLLSSGDPASVVVGARLERTRVVGTSTGIAFNPLARAPLVLGF
jgi:hypothetical protein